MNNTIIALLVGVSAGTFIFAKVQRSSGGNNQSAGIVAGIAGVLIFIVAIFLLKFIPQN